jgi:hypothetical protein
MMLQRTAFIFLLSISALAMGAGPAPATQPATRPATVWGEATEGVQCALRAEKARFARGDHVGLVVSVRNIGQRELFVARNQETCEIEVDGRWYQYFGDVDVKSSPLGPGREYGGIRISLDADWSPLGDHGRLRLPLAPGKHSMRVAIVAQNEQAFEPVARAASPVVEFETE